MVSEIVVGLTYSDERRAKRALATFRDDDALCVREIRRNTAEHGEFKSARTRG